MDRTEATGFGVAVAGHVALLGALFVGLATVKPPQIRNNPIEVSFVDEVGLESTAPVPSSELPAPKLGEIEGPPEPLAAPVPEPLPAPPQIQPQPQPRVAATRPQPAPQPRPQPPRPAAKATPAPPQQKAAATRPTGRLSGLLNGIGDRESPSKRTTPPAAVMSGQAAASIGALIRRQVQPCADRLVNPGPGASRIKVRINLKLNRDGSLKTRPTVEGVTGLDDENRRYAQRVKEMAVAAFTSCSPLRGLPPELYAVANGWSDFDMNYNLP